MGWVDPIFPVVWMEGWVGWNDSRWEYSLQIRDEVIRQNRPDQSIPLGWRERRHSLQPPPARFCRGAARTLPPLLRLDAGRLPRRRSHSSAWTPVVYLNVGRRRYSARCSSAESPPAKLRVLVPAESPIGDAPSPARRVAVRSPSRAAHSRSSACSPLPSRLPALLLRRPAESPAPLPARCRPARRGELLRRPAPPSGLSSGGSGDGECCGGGSGDGEGCGDGSGLSLSAADLADAVVAEPQLLAVKADTIARRRSAAPSCLAARRISVVEREVRAEAEVAMVIANGVVSGCKRYSSHSSLVPSTKQKNWDRPIQQTKHTGGIVLTPKSEMVSSHPTLS
ncbi:hypothetical protein OsJ_23424 [Oryza sativa Japonica Group]|uniref:Uncharacterized protein n=1 Tax=Oryza sativa subsp. japonica TaxID=39947 RepID=Q5Z7X9_ORYSJ|nr:uncharacterized protein LOC112939379 [Oryza sativa Japonica Group]EEE66733.1 hypothetical protein OsJ_23424 [Oryza sativa Japonica Group]BAD61769.1 hypothetical protein [Oryza sativa Japonica Group]